MNPMQQNFIQKSGGNQRENVNEVYAKKTPNTPPLHVENIDSRVK